MRNNRPSLAAGAAGPSIKRLILILGLLLALAGCNQGTPYAFRLMIPPESAAGWLYAMYLPYWFWEERSVHERFSQCEEIRFKIRFQHRPASLPPEKLWGYERYVYARCVPLR